MNRLCFFAGYDSNGNIADYVVYYVKAMSKLADVYYLADCSIKHDELEKLKPYVKEAYAYRHKKYDFGSWQELYNKIGEEKIAEYDELVFCNDSCFGPLKDLEPFFEKASDDKGCDFWGMTIGSQGQQTEHIQSYFMVFKRNVFVSGVFKDFINHIKPEDTQIDVIRFYETKLTPLLVKEGFKPKYHIQTRGCFTVFSSWKSLVISGFPFIKVKNFTFGRTKSDIDCVYRWENFLRKYSSYPTQLIAKYLKSKNIDMNLNGLIFKSSFLWSRIKRLRRILFYIKFRGRKKIVRIFGMYLLYHDDEHPRYIPKSNMDFFRNNN